MHIQRWILSLVSILIFSILIYLPACNRAPGQAHNTLNAEEQLGKMLFFDESLSSPAGQSCSSCHDPRFAFADPQTELPVSKGAVRGLYGNRNDMPVSYARYVPPLHYDSLERIWKGGLFWDGRANSLINQAMGPLMNPLEMANPDATAVAEKIRALEYADLFSEIYGEGALDDPESAVLHLAEAIAAFEKSGEVSPFSSKFDLWKKGEASLTQQEQRGFMLFVVESKGNCASCHPHTPSEDGTPALFTDFSYDNLGIPFNYENPFLKLPEAYNPEGTAYRDGGLGEYLGDAAERGKFRVPTLRNVAITAPYMHNGVFKTLFQVISFYNTRDVEEWPEPEVPENMDQEHMGDLGLSNQEIEDLVAFLGTLTDGWNEP